MLREALVSALPKVVPAVSYRPVFEDPSLPHQIVLRLTGGNSHRIMVSCNCLRTGRSAFAPIEVRTRWEAPEAIAVWRKHLEEASDAA